MKKHLARFAGLAALALVIAACTIALPPIDMASWFGGDTGSVVVTNGDASVTSPEAITVDEIPAFSRGGIGLSSISVDGGSLTYVGPGTGIHAAQDPLPSNPDLVKFEIYLSVTAMESATEGSLLVAFEIPVNDGNLVPPVEITDGIFDSVLTAALNEGSFYAGLVIEVWEGDAKVTDDWTLSIDGMWAEATLSLF